MFSMTVLLNGVLKLKQKGASNVDGCRLICHQMISHWSYFLFLRADVDCEGRV